MRNETPDDSQRIDPVRGMTVEDGGITVRHEDRTYHFCSEVCGHQFERNPGACVGEEFDRNVSFARGKLGFWVVLSLEVLSNMLGVAGLQGYLVNVYGAGFFPPYLAVKVFGIVLGTAISVAGTLYFLPGVLQHFRPPSPPPDSDEIDDQLRREALNSTVVLSSLSQVLWLLIGSTIAVIIQSDYPVA